jgi:hypothetical protein
METIINIGTDKENIVGVKVKKHFRDITYQDIKEIVIKELGTLDGNNIQGWCDVTNKKK